MVHLQTLKYINIWMYVCILIIADFAFEDGSDIYDWLHKLISICLRPSEGKKPIHVQQIKNNAI